MTLFVYGAWCMEFGNNERIMIRPLACYLYVGHWKGCDSRVRFWVSVATMIITLMQKSKAAMITRLIPSIHSGQEHCTTSYR